MKEIKRGDVFMMYCDGQGCEQSGYRPVLVIQNDKGNEYSPTTIVAALTARITKRKLPVHAFISRLHKGGYLNIVLCEQIRTVDKNRLLEYVTTIKPEAMEVVDNCLRCSLGI